MPERKRLIDKILGFIGIHIPYGRNDKLHIEGRFFVFLGVVFAGGILFLLIFMFGISTSPRFCGTCHVMKPYYQSWKHSRHREVPCVECHYPPDLRGELKLKWQATTQVVKYLTKTYGTKPYAEIEDASCLREGCHSRASLSGRKVEFVKSITFDHGPHFREMRNGATLRCTTCHSQVVVNNHMQVAKETCFICHFKGKTNGRELHPVGECTGCHKPPEEEIEYQGITINHQEFAKGVANCTKCHLDVVEGDGHVEKAACYDCHNEQDKIEKYGETRFLHVKHITEHKVECLSCHSPIKHKVKTVVGPLEYSCEVCHVNKHNAQKNMYAGIGARGVPNMPSPMFLAQVDCVGCHILPKERGLEKELKGKTYFAVEAACIGCHGEDYRGILSEWVEDVNSAFKKLEKEIKRTKPVVEAAKKSGKYSSEAIRLYNQAYYNYEFLKYGKGVHNVDYATTIAEKSISFLKKARKLLTVKGARR